MIKCQLCDFQCQTNSGGDLTKHIKNVHDKTLSEYVIITEYNDIPPKCQCGYCDDIPEFYRGYFKKYAYGHNSVEWINKKRIELNIIPKCLNCGKELELNKSRKKLNMFCSFTCSGTFNKDVIIEKMTPKVKIIMNSPTRKKLSSDTFSALWKDPVYHKEHTIKLTKASNTPHVKLLKSIKSKKLWNDPDYKKRVSNSIKISLNTPEIKEFRRVMAIKYGNLCNLSFRLSKLHINRREKLSLSLLGFSSECRISNYIVDELNDDLKIIIEINGDYVHGNPSKYASDYVIRLAHRSYTASEKWIKDANRKTYLESLGYTVFTIWESDDIDDIRSKLMTLLENRRSMMYSKFDYVI